MQKGFLAARSSDLQRTEKKFRDPVLRWARLLALGSTLLFLGLPFRARAAGRQQLKGHRTASAFQAPLVGEMSGTEKIDLVIGLPSKDPAGLADFLKRLYNPHGSQFGHYLKKGEFAQRFGASASDYQAVVDFARSNGLTVENTHSSRTVLFVSGASADVQKAFHVHLHYYQRPDGTRFFAPEEQPSVDLDVPLSNVGGLDNFIKPHRSSGNFTPIAGGNGKMKPNSILGSGPAGNFISQDFRNAYAPNVSLNGAGQTLGLYEGDGYTPGDITLYESQTGLPDVNVVPILVDGVDGGAGPANTEVALDIESAIAMAPGLSQVRVYEGISFNAAPFGDDVFAAIADDDLAQQISCSWTFEAFPTTALIFEQMAAQGQSFFEASGDDGGYAPPLNSVFLEDQDFVTDVGGTVLTMNGNGASYNSETGDTISGGGTSSDFPIPFYQTGISMAANGGSTIFRNFPDVAMDSENVYVVATNYPFSGGNPVTGVAFSSGGTSASTPLWAGFMALVNQQRAQNGQAPLGFANPALYAIGEGPDYAADFHDVISGNNGMAGSATFFAVPGYDLVTGLGSPSGQPLINDLCPGCVSASTPTAVFTPTVGAATATPTSGPCLSFDGKVTGPLSGGGFMELDIQGLAVDSSGNLYAANSNGPNVERFSPSGAATSITYGDGSGSGPGQLQSPKGVALDPAGNVFVTDANNRRVVKYDPNGNALTSFGGGTFSFPEGIACDSSGNVFVADPFNSQVYEFTNTGASLETVGSGLLSQPLAVALDASNNLYVMDSGHNRIVKFNSAGTLLAQWGGAGSGPGQFASAGGGSMNQLCIAGPGLVFAVDSGNNRVEIFSPTGAFLGQVAGFGFTTLTGIAGDANRLYVSDNTTFSFTIFDLGNCPAGPVTPPPTPTGSVTPTLIFTKTPTPTVTATPTLPCIPSGAVWVPATTNAAFSPRSDFGSVVFNNRMWVAGGEMQSPAGPSNGNVSGNDVWSSSDGAAWSAATLSASFPPREDFTLLAFDPGDGLGQRMYLIGGFNPFTTPPNTVYNDVWSSLDGAHWSLVTSNATFPARIGPACLVFNNRMWVMGGGGFDDVWSSSDGVKWVQNVQHVPGFLGGVSDGAVLDGQMDVMSQSNQGANPCSIFSSTDGYVWVTEESDDSVDNFAELAFAGDIWVIGGTTGISRSNLAFSSPPNFSEWPLSPPAATFAPRGAHQGGLVFNNQMWVIGGDLAPAVPGGATQFANDVWHTVCGSGGGGGGNGAIPPGVGAGQGFNQIITLQVPLSGASNSSVTVKLPAFTQLVSSSLTPASVGGNQLIFNYPSLPAGTTQFVLSLSVSPSAPAGTSLVSQVSAGGAIAAMVSPPNFQVLGPSVTPTPTPSPTSTFTPTPTPTATFEFSGDCKDGPCHLRCGIEEDGDSDHHSHVGRGPDHASGIVQLHWEEARQGFFHHPDGYWLFRAPSTQGPYVLIQTITASGDPDHDLDESTTDQPGPGSWCYGVRAFGGNPVTASEATEPCCVVVEGGMAMTPTSTATPTVSPTGTLTPGASPTPTPTQAWTWWKKTGSEMGPALSPTAGNYPGGTRVSAAPNISRNGSPIQFRVPLGQPEKVDLALYSLSGEEIYETSVEGRTGLNSLVWPVENRSGGPAASGLYVYVVRIGDGSQSTVQTGKVAVIR